MHTATYIHSTPNGEELISYMARVSNPANQNNKDTAPKLIKYLIKHKHWSPFEMVSMCVQIDTTRSVASQILRHRSFSFQEFSQRYAQVTQDPIVPHFRSQDTKNRQNSKDDIHKAVQSNLQYKTKCLFDQSVKLYNELIKDGVAKETARDVLPLGTPTSIYMHGTLRSWLHYCDLRCSNGTQLEHQMIAKDVKSIIAQYFPQVFVSMWSND